MGKIEVTVEVDEALLEQVKAAGIDVSAVAEQALRVHLVKSPDAGDRQAKAWAEENAEAIAAYNADIAEHGLPLADLRKW